MGIGKTDMVTPKIARISNKNPLDKIEIVLDLLYVDEDYKDVDPTSKASRLHENEVF